MKYGAGMMNRLDSITSRSKTNRLYLIVFATMLGLVTFVSVSSVGSLIAQHLASR